MYRQGRYVEALDELNYLSDETGLIGRLGRFYRGMCHRAIGVEALSEREFPTAEEHLRSAVDSVGRTGDLAGYLASLYAGTDRYARCAEEMAKVAESDPDSATVRRKLALAQWKEGKRPIAYMTLTEGLRNLGDKCELYLQLGIFHAAEEQYEQARASFAAAVQADSTNPEAHYYLALAAAAQGDVLLAMRSFQRAFELRPNNLILAYQLALAGKAAEENGHSIFLRLPEPVTSSEGPEICQLARYVCREPDFVEAFLELPPSEIDEELFGLLSGVLQVAIDEHGDYADLHHHISRVFHRLGRTEPAIEEAQKALAINPRYVQALIHAGRVYAETHRFKDAIGHLERAVECGGDWADVHCLMGELLREQNELEEARIHLNRALEINGGYVRAAEVLSALAA